MPISTGNRPKGLVVGMSATDTITPAEGPMKLRQKAAKLPKLSLPKPAKRKKLKPPTKGSLLATLTKLMK